VHSGEDLGASLRSVLGYRQESVKGKAIEVAPISSVASDSLSALLEICGPSQASGSQDTAESVLFESDTFSSYFSFFSHFSFCILF
jgi:hypothetical protein